MSKTNNVVYFSVVMLLVALVASTAFLIPTSNRSQDDYTEAIVQARIAIWKDINTGGASSGAIAIMDGGRIVYSEGFGMANRENSTPVNSNTVYNIGSISKAFCAVAVMKLADDGKIKLDDPVVKYLPEFTMADPRYQNIMVRMLLNHQSGLPGTVSANADCYQYNPNFYQEALAAFANAHLRSNPGEFAPYTNDGFTLAEMLVAKVSGQNYSEYLRQEIYQPLGLSHTGVSGDLEGKVRAEFYRLDNGQSTPAEVLSVLGAGGLSSTAVDLVRFADSFSVGGKQILSQSSIDEMTKAQPSAFAAEAMREAGINPEMSFGLGLDLVDVPYYSSRGVHVIGKGGDTSDYHSMLLSAPDQRISVAVTETGHECNAAKIAIKTLNTVLQLKGVIQKDTVPEVTPPPSTEPIPASYSAFEGYYAGRYKVSFDFQSNACVVTILGNDGSSSDLLLSYRDGNFYLGDGSELCFITVNGHNYLLIKIWENMVYMGFMEQVPAVANPQSLAIDVNGVVWLRRNVAPYEGLTGPSHVSVSGVISDLPGYVMFSGLKQVESPTYAGMPAQSVRDQTELNLINRDGEVWAQVYDALYCQSTLAAPISKGSSAVAIGADGYSQWGVLVEDSVLSFQKPAGDHVWVFSAAGGLIYDSATSSSAVYAPAGSYVEFAGYNGDVLGVTAK